jgi:aryl-alcohol dehydrogenase-like predicted oxidoreductase
MRYKTLGTTGLVVSRMAFGAMTFTQGNTNIAAIYKVGEKLASELVGRALDAGVNLFDTADGYAGFDLLPFDKEHRFRLVEQIRPIAERHGASVAQVALAWLLSKDAVTSILIGATKLAQLEDNLKAIDLKLDGEEVKALDEATTLPPVYPTWFIERLVDAELEEALAG